MAFDLCLLQDGLANYLFGEEMREFQLEHGSGPYYWPDFVTYILDQADANASWGFFVPSVIPDCIPDSFMGGGGPMPPWSDCLKQCEHNDHTFVQEMINFQATQSGPQYSWDLFLQYLSDSGRPVPPCGPPPEFNACTPMAFAYNQCVGCNTSQPVYKDGCGNYTVGGVNNDSACSGWCQPAPPEGCSPPVFKYNQCVGCGAYEPVYQDGCGNWSVGKRVVDTSVCTEYCKNVPPPRPSSSSGPIVVGGVAIVGILVAIALLPIGK